ncbi:MAG: CoA-binding protein [Peptococcaceae bacterium]|jgi:predicted CoA-binding protein|nr:CoA-binding protein [Peptococcaceae bacterium]
MDEATMLQQRIWAVVGATQDPEKFGYKLYKKLKSKEYRVYAVNPLYDQIDGDKCYQDLSSLPEIPQVVNMVVSPKRGKAVIEEAARLGIKYVWFQPGTVDDELLKLTKNLGLESVQGCVLVSA